MGWHKDMLIMPRASICQEYTNLSTGKPKLPEAGCSCSVGMFHILHLNGFALMTKVGHDVQGEVGAGRNVW